MCVASALVVSIAPGSASAASRHATARKGTSHQFVVGFTNPTAAVQVLDTIGKAITARGKRLGVRHPGLSPAPSMRIARGDCRGKIAPGNRVKRQREIVRPEYADRADRRQLRTDIVHGINHHPPPAPLPCGRRSLPQLPDGARQLHGGQPRLNWQRGFAIRQRA